MKQNLLNMNSLQILKKRWNYILKRIHDGGETCRHLNLEKSKYMFSCCFYHSLEMTKIRPYVKTQREMRVNMLHQSLLCSL